jgi:hypothetical protein
MAVLLFINVAIKHCHINKFFSAVLLAPCGATAKHGNYYDRKFTFFKLEKKYLLAGVIIGFLRDSILPTEFKVAQSA